MSWHIRHAFAARLRNASDEDWMLPFFERAITLLQASGTLPAEYRPHKLSGKYTGYWECHLQPDWLLIWLQDDQRLVLHLIDTGTHADLF